MSKHKGETGRNPPSFNLETLNSQQKKLHEDITASWNELCTQHASLGRMLIEMHKTFTRSGAVKRGGPNSRWTRYLSAVGIPKSTAQDYMNLAKKREEAGISAKAEKHLARVGVPLDRPKVVDALLTPELRKQVEAINSARDAEALKPLIMETAREPQAKSKNDKPLSAGDASTIAKAKAIVAAVHYLDQFDGKVFRAKFVDFWRELRQELWDKLAPVGGKKAAAIASESEAMEAAV